MRNLRQDALDLLRLSAEAGRTNVLVKIKEHPGCRRPAWDVFVKSVGAKRGKCVFTLITHYNQL